MIETDEQRRVRHEKGLFAIPTYCKGCGTLYTEDDAHIVVHGTMTIFYIDCTVCGNEFKLKKPGERISDPPS